MIYGTEDQFTGVGGFRAVLSDLQGQALRGWEVEGADHFFRGEMGEELQGGIRAWLQS
jgi:alpha/beta superfamily hydrolase